MSARKKKIVSDCPGCSCYVLTKDAEKHKVACGGEPDESPTQLISPKVALVAQTYSVEKRETKLPRDFFGWHRYENALLHPETLSMLGVLPRSSAIVKVDETEKVLVLWPCDEVPQMRICLVNVPNERRAVVLPVLNPVVLDKILLSAVIADEKLVSSTIFNSFASIYFADAFLMEDAVISVRYFGQTFTFKLEACIDKKLASMSLDGTKEGPTVVRLKTNPKICFTTSGEVGASKVTPLPRRLGFERIGGLSRGKQDLLTYLIGPVKSDADPCSVIIWGLSGSGKTLLLEAITDLLPDQTILLKTSTTVAELEATSNPERVLLIDNFESIKQEAKNAESNVDVLCRLMDEKRYKAIVVVARAMDNIDLRLRRRFPVEIEILVPNPIERLEILRVHLEERGVPLDAMQTIARESHGFTGADLVAMIQLANHQSTDLSLESLTSARRRIRPTGIRQFILEVPNVKWTDIAGEEELKREIEQAVIWPFQHPEAFARLGVEPPSGILLYGPPGCSKTLVARALASQSKLNFLSVKGPELFSKWVGESERAVRDLFHRARQVAPAVLFFDEIDAVATKRGSESSSGVSDRVLAQLLTELDGLEKATGVIVLAATNRPEILDGAILRPGRLDRSLYVPLPDEVTRTAIIRLQMEKMSVSDAQVNVCQLAQKTNGYSGAEIVALCKNAALLAMRENLHDARIEERHFGSALEVVVPRTDKKVLAVYEKFSKGIQI